MGTYDIQINGGTLIVKVVDRAALVTTELSQLRSLIGTTTPVGFMVKSNPASELKNGVRCPSDLQYSNCSMLQLCVENRCLVILLAHLDSFPQCLKDFLNDQGINFVGDRMSYGLSVLKSSYGIKLQTGVNHYIEVSEFASRVLKKPNICGSYLETIEKEVGFSRGECSKSVSIKDWGAKVFSVGEMQYAIQDVYSCYQIGNKLLNMLDELEKCSIIIYFRCSFGGVFHV
ncbi:hypothetical protein Vadar_018163 [Vaccinium darrowii]|uniref:Uncharacterized protein n=1 Tax=Vaccinium darrowii TaxID=229202 RepID=A0ACB7ZKY7_9ERIC|nr:hypothetical protein Vadar_018163 [Vaccinium darrowii]